MKFLIFKNNEFLESIEFQDDDNDCYEKLSELYPLYEDDYRYELVEDVINVTDLINEYNDKKMNLYRKNKLQDDRFTINFMGYTRDILLNTLGTKYNISYYEIDNIIKDINDEIEKFDILQSLSGVAFEKTFSPKNKG